MTTCTTCRYPYAGSACDNLGCSANPRVSPETRDRWARERLAREAAEAERAKIARIRARHRCYPSGHPLSSPEEETPMEMIEFVRTPGRTMEFPHPGEVFVTVRRGGKWGRYGGRVGIGSEMVAIDPATDEVLGRVELLARQECQLQQVHPRWMTLEHDPAARSLSGLLETLRQHYPEIEADHNVTALLLRRVR